VAAASIGVAIASIFALIGGLAWHNSIIRRHEAELERQVQRANRLASEAETHSRTAEIHRRVAEERGRLAARQAYAASLREASRALDDHKLELAQDILHAMASGPFRGRPGEFAWGHLWRRANREVSQWRGHDAAILAMRTSPDGRMLVTDDLAGKLLVWDVEAGLAIKEPRFTFSTRPARHRQSVFSGGPRPMLAVGMFGDGDGKDRMEVLLADLTTGRSQRIEIPGEFRMIGFSSEGRRLICVVRDRAGISRARLVDPREGVVLEMSWEIGKVPTAPVFSPDGRYVATFESGRVTLRDPETGRSLVSLQPEGINPESNSSKFVAFSGDTRHAAMRSGRQVVLCETEEGREVARIDSAEEIILFQPDPTGSRIAILDASGWARIHDRVAGGVRSLAQSALDRRVDVHRIAFSTDGSRLALSILARNPNERPPTVWEVSTGHRLARFPGRQVEPTILFSGDGHSLYLISGRSPECWRIDSQPDLTELPPLDEEVWALAISRDGKRLAIGTDDAHKKETIQLRELESGRLIEAWKGHSATVCALEFSPDGKYLASGSLDLNRGNVILWDVATERRARLLEGHVGFVRSVAFSRDGRSLITASDDLTVRTWDVATGRVTGILKGHRDKVTQAVASPDGRDLASVSLDGHAILWDAGHRTSRLILNTPEQLQAVAYSPDGTLLATAGGEGVIAVWDAGRGERIRTIHAESDELRCLTFSPDGKILAAAGVGKVVRLWDVLSGQELLSLKGHKAQINTLAFAPDGNLLVSADHAGAVRLWRAHPPLNGPRVSSR